VENVVDGETFDDSRVKECEADDAVQLPIDELALKVQESAVFRERRNDHPKLDWETGKDLEKAAK